MTDHVHVVRKLRPGEAFPRYSTAALLFGCTFPTLVDVSETKRNHPAPDPTSHKTKKEQTEKRGYGLTDEFYDARSRFYADERAKLIPVIREKLLQKKARPVIAKEIGVSLGHLRKIIRDDAELKKLAAYLPNIGAQVMAQRCREKFRPHETDIEKWLAEGKTYQFIADRVGVNKSTICYYINKHPDLQVICKTRKKK